MGRKEQPAASKERGKLKEDIDREKEKRRRKEVDVALALVTCRFRIVRCPPKIIEMNSRFLASRDLPRRVSQPDARSSESASAPQPRYHTTLACSSTLASASVVIVVIVTVTP